MPADQNAALQVFESGWRMGPERTGRHAMPADERMIEALGLSEEEADVVRHQLELADQLTGQRSIGVPHDEPRDELRAADQSAIDSRSDPLDERS